MKNKILIIITILSQLFLANKLFSQEIDIKAKDIEFSNDLRYVITSVGTWGERTPPGVEEDIKGNKTYWTTHRGEFPQNKENSDIAILQGGKVSISPINPSFTIDEVSNGSFSLKMK